MRYALCHTNRRYLAKGLCHKCYYLQPEVREAQRTYSSRYYKANRDKAIASTRNWQRNHPAEHHYINRKHALKVIYNMTPADEKELRKSQEDKCAICGKKPRRLVLDHCHKIDKVRGFLCYKCNLALGQFNDDKTLLMKAIEYLDNPPYLKHIYLK